MTPCLLALSVLLASLGGGEGVVKVVTTAVVFTNSLGGGEDELQAPANRNASKLFDAGGPVVAAWWTPLNQITDLTAIYRIDTLAEGHHVKLVVAGRVGQRDARVRIKIYADVISNSSGC